jgi:hypothetical protein
VLANCAAKEHAVAQTLRGAGSAWTVRCGGCAIDTCAGSAHSTDREAEMPATLVAAPHNRHHRAGCIRHARKRMIQVPAVICRGFRSGAPLISEWLQPEARRRPGYSTAGGSLVERFAILDARATQSVSLELLSSGQVPFCDRADSGVCRGEQEKQRPLADCSGHPFHKTQFVVGARDSATSSFLARSWFTCRCSVRRRSGC